mgnify:CR=1 FL=1
MKIYKISNEVDFALICERIGVRNAGRAASGASREGGAARNRGAGRA